MKEHEPTINNHALAFREIFFLTNVVTYVVDSSVGVFIWTGRKGRFIKLNKIEEGSSFESKNYESSKLQQKLKKFQF